MIEKSKNKQITGAKNKTEAELQDFHFSGSGEYEPMTIKASNIEEAEEIWKKQRKKVEKSQIINE